MNRFVFWVFLIFTASTTFAQSVLDRCDYKPPKEANNWQFYSLSGMSFNTNPPQVLYNNNGLVLGKSTAVMSDEEGNLLFYTNGQAVWNRNYQMMPHGTDIYGNTGCSQSSVIVQHPIHDVLYYLFTVDLLELPGLPQSGRGFRFSLVDMRMEGGMGDVANPNVPLLDQTAEKLTAVQHANGADTWVITHGYNGGESTRFYAFHVNVNGVNETPVVSDIGTPQEGSFETNNSAGYMKASPDGEKLALTIYGKGIIEIFDFNTATGAVTNARTSGPDFDYAYGVEFSPDASKLYVSTTPVIDIPPIESYIFQFDANSSDPFLQYTTLAASRDSIYGAMQLGTDGKIYVSRYVDIQNGKSFLGLIENPNRPGTACNYKDLGFSLGSNEARNGLPNFMTGYLDIPDFTYLNHCHQDTTTFKITNYVNIDSQTWNFGDPGGSGNTSTDATPSHIFSQPGDYTVNLTERYESQDYVSTGNVTIYPKPAPDLGPDTIWLYPGAQYTLDAGSGYDYYYWNFSDYPSGQTYNISDTGTYYVTVVDSNCCYNTDSVIVIPSQVYLPNAFTPNGDQLNDVLRPIGPTGGIMNFNLLIFNRWGQLVFEGNDINESWDGNIRNEPAPPGVYVYRVTYDVELDFGVYKDIELKGYVTLLR